MSRKIADVRVRAVLAVGVSLAIGVLLLEMSVSAPRTAGSDHVSAPVFAAVVPGGGVLCQPVSPVPDDARSVRLLIGTYGRPVPAVSIQFTSATAASVAHGELAAGSRQGYVTIPIGRVTPSSAAGTMCLHVGGSAHVAVGGESGPLGPGSERVDGRPQGGNIALLYLRGGSETWWQLLPVLSERFGLSKAGFFGTWTLPAVVLVMIGVWAGAIRLLARELG